MQSHEVLTKLVGRTDTRVPNLVEVTVLHLSIPLLHEIDPQNPQRSRGRGEVTSDIKPNIALPKVRPKHNEPGQGKSRNAQRRR